MANPHQVRGTPNRLNIDREVFRENFGRAPFSFSHTLHLNPAFGHDALVELAGSYKSHPQDYYIAASAASAGTAFTSVVSPELPLDEALQVLDSSALRILLKRPETHDLRFRHLLEELFEEIRGLYGKRIEIKRLESAIFITSAASITPFHFDPETAFFSQIAGDKTYHVYSPAVLSDLELEQFYMRGIVSIGQVSMEGRNKSNESVFRLRPGVGFYQPQNAPHWVENRFARSISYSLVYETAASRSIGNTRAFNHFLRKSRIEPDQIGAHPTIDTLKALAIRPLIRARNKYNRLSSRLRPILVDGHISFRPCLPRALAVKTGSNKDGDA